MKDWREDFWKLLSPETAARLRADLERAGDWDKQDEAAAERAADLKSLKD
jgi:hypothetical protein